MGVPPFAARSPGILRYCANALAPPFRESNSSNGIFIYGTEDAGEVPLKPLGPCKQPLYPRLEVFPFRGLIIGNESGVVNYPEGQLIPDLWYRSLPNQYPNSQPNGRCPTCLGSEDHCIFSLAKPSVITLQPDGAARKHRRSALRGAPGLGPIRPAR